MPYQNVPKKLPCNVISDMRKVHLTLWGKGVQEDFGD